MMKVKKIPVKQREVNVSLGNTWGITKGMMLMPLGSGKSQSHSLGTDSVSSQGSVDLDDIVPLIHRPDTVILHVGG